MFFEIMGVSGFDRLGEVIIACRGLIGWPLKSSNETTTANKIGSVFGAQFALQFAAMCAKAPAMAA